MDNHEEHVIIARGLYLLSGGKLVEKNYWIHSVFWTKEEEGAFHTVWTYER